MEPTCPATLTRLISEPYTHATRRRERDGGIVALSYAFVKGLYSAQYMVDPFSFLPGFT